MNYTEMGSQMKDQVHELIKICDELLDRGVRYVGYSDADLLLDVELVKSIAICQELNPISLTGSFPRIEVKDE